MAKIASIPLRTRRAFLNRRETLVLDNAQGTIIAVDRGCLWVTLEHDVRDIVLAKGMRFQIDRSGRTIIAAEADSRLRLFAPETLGHRIATAMRRAVARTFNAWAARPTRRAVPYF
jgi:Protein of unknown function (DUF2917)